MQVSYNWLKEYVDIDITAEALAELMTRAGVVVEHVIPTNKGIEKVVTARVLTKEKHPEADKLSLCTVTTDGENAIQVVCGAPNVAAGLVIPFAMVGARLPEGVEITKAKLRGVESNGMICSAKELGIDPEKIPPEQKDGILILPADTPLGLDIAEVIGLNDYILELDLTPNRSDCLSALNVAYEVGALLGKPVRVPEVTLTENQENVHDLAQVDIQDSQLCHRFTGRVVKGITIKPSPFWLQHRLQCAGVRPINNIVDVTNYVMMELGQPLHAYDYRTLAGHRITVRRAAQDEVIVTLDGQSRKLTDQMLLICDDDRAVGVAGVMGGENTEVTDQTTDVFIEAAYFQPTSVRRTSTALGLRSEASIRFEKGIDIQRVSYACDRAAQLMQLLGGGEIAGGMIDQFPTPHEPVLVTLPFAKAGQVVGVEISAETITDILQRLQFQVTAQTAEAITVQVPTWRPDVSIAEDLIEEVARVYGYDNIPVTLPGGVASQGKLTGSQKIRALLVNKLAAMGLNEIITYSFINKNNDDKLLLPAGDKRRDSIPILNPLSEEQGHMRTSMLPGLLNTVKSNINRRNEDLAFFEMGKVFLLDGALNAQTLANEKWSLSIVLRGKTAVTWQQGGDSYDFYYLKGVVERLLAALKLEQVAYLPYSDNPTYHPGRTALVMAGSTIVGTIGELHPQVADNYGIGGKIYAAELDVDALTAIGLGKTNVRQLPKFPAVTRDMAVVVDEGTVAGDLLQTITQTGGALLSDVRIFDVYHGGQIEAGKKSVAFALTFQSEERTLTDSEVNGHYDVILAALAEQYGAVLRA